MKVSKAQSDLLLKRTRNCLIKCISVVCVFVCVFESVVKTLFYFSAVPTKLLIRYIFIILSWS